MLHASSLTEMPLDPALKQLQIKARGIRLRKPACSTHLKTRQVGTVKRTKKEAAEFASLCQVSSLPRFLFCLFGFCQEYEAYVKEEAGRPSWWPAVDSMQTRR